MKRREFLVGGMTAVAAGATGGAGFNQIIAPSWSNVTSAEMNRFLAQLDAAMHLIEQDPAGGRFLDQLQGRSSTAEDASLFRRGMRSLLLVGNFGDLSLAGQVHPGVQKRLRYSAPEFDSAVIDVMNRMKSLTPTARADIKSALSRDPGLADRVLEAIDLEAGSIGVPSRRRLQLRTMGMHITRRLKQSSDMLIDEYVTKCEKLSARLGSAAEMQRLMATRMGEAAFQAHVRKAENEALRWQELDLEDVPIGYRLIVDDEEDGERSDRWYRTGLRLLGFGAISTAVGWLLIAISGEGGPLVWPGVVLGVTVGPIALVLGLLTLLIGALIDIGDGP